MNARDRKIIRTTVDCIADMIVDQVEQFCQGENHVSYLHIIERLREIADIVESDRGPVRKVALLSDDIAILRGLSRFLHSVLLVAAEDDR